MFWGRAGFRGRVELGGRDVTQSSLSVASHEKMPKHTFTQVRPSPTPLPDAGIESTEDLGR